MSLSKEAWSPRIDLERAAANDPSLTVVGWFRKGIGDDEVIKLAEALRDNTHVTHLTLGANKITDVGAKALAEMLRINGTVTFLNLAGNQISDAGAKDLAEVLRVNGTVTKLSLWRNNISADLEEKVNQLVEINKEAEFRPPPRQATTEATASLLSEYTESEGAEATTVAKPPAPSQDVAANPPGRDSSDWSGRRAHNRSEQDRRDRELAERLQREEEERASSTTHTAAANQGVAAAAGTRGRPAAAAAPGAAGAAPPHTPSGHAHGQSLTREEQAAVAHLTKNISDIDRSLESVRGVPESLAGAAPEAQRYFLTFCAAFERAYVAAQALASGAVKVQLSSMKDQMLEGVLKAVGDVAGASNIPALGMISIVSSAIMYPRETRQLNVLSVFQDFFRGDSRDQYLITYRQLAEQICRRVNFVSYASDVERQKHYKQRVKKLLQPIRKRLESAHFLQLDNVQPIDDMATADLAEVTESVLALRLEDENKFESLKAGSEEERVKFLLEQLQLDSLVPHCYFGTQSDQAFQRPRQTATPNSQREENSEPAERSEPAKDAAWFQEMEREIERLRKVERQHKAVQQRLRRLEEKVGSERDITTSGGGSQVQVQLLRSRNARSGHRGAAQTSAELDSFQRDVYRDLQGIKAAMAAAQSEQVAANTLQSFVSNRVLTRSEAFQLIEHVVMLAGVEVSASGAFTFEGKGYKIGLYSSRLLSARKNLWKDRAQLKIDQVYNGSKPVSHWFQQNELLFIYESNIKRAVRQLFADEFDVISASTSRVSEDATHEMEQDRRRLFGNDYNELGSLR